MIHGPVQELGSQRFFPAPYIAGFHLGKPELTALVLVAPILNTSCYNFSSGSINVGKTTAAAVVASDTAHTTDSPCNILKGKFIYGAV